MDQAYNVCIGEHESWEKGLALYEIKSHEVLGDILAAYGNEAQDLLPFFKRLEKAFKKEEEGEDWGGFGYELNAWYQALELAKNPAERRALEKSACKKLGIKKFFQGFNFLEDCPDSWDSSFLRELQESLRREIRRHAF